MCASHMDRLPKKLRKLLTNTHTKLLFFLQINFPPSSELKWIKETTVLKRKLERFSRTTWNYIHFLFHTMRRGALSVLLIWRRKMMIQASKWKREKWTASIYFNNQIAEIYEYIDTYRVVKREVKRNEKICLFKYVIAFISINSFATFFLQ